jgi:Transposase DDE domain group 1
MENRIKECQLDLYADRTSTATMRANQLRLWFASMAYVLVCALRHIGLYETEYANGELRASVSFLLVFNISGSPAKFAAIMLASSRVSAGLARDTEAGLRLD